MSRRRKRLPGGRAEVGCHVMRVVEYPRSLQWVGDLKCPRCEGLTAAWRSSSMSDACPHFYCDRCSNVILREADRELVYRRGESQDVVEEIAASLPECPCGGRFSPGADPKCRHCGAVVPNRWDVVRRLGDPQMIVVDGACVFSDVRAAYCVRIVEGGVAEGGREVGASVGGPPPQPSPGVPGEGERGEPSDTSAEVPCHRCGYDLRAHPEEGRCPECGASVAEARRVAAVPRRPAWGESDPRWRRRMVAGAWVLVLLPVMEVLRTFGWDSRVPVPAVFDFRGTVRTLGDTLLSYVYEPLVFCVALVLLFSKERGRRGGRLDWTRRWGVLCCYVVLLLSAAQVLFIAALVLVGIAALFQAMALKYQPGVTPLLVKVSTAYLRYGPYPKDVSAIVLVVFSSVAVLLACVPLYDALRSSGSRRVAAALVGPLGAFAVVHLAQAGRAFLGFARVISMEGELYPIYFTPGALVGRVAMTFGFDGSGAAFGVVFVEAVKWCVLVVVAVWLSVAQLGAWVSPRRHGDTEGNSVLQDASDDRIPDDG